MITNLESQENLVGITVQTELLQRIARYLMLHDSTAKSLGLLDGKMGITIFFYHYARYANKQIYDDFARELVDEIYKEIHLGYPVNFEKGLSGIAWGMEYLIQNRFVEADADEVLEELDMQILERDVRRIKDISLETGLKGLAHYVISRCGNRNNLNPFISPEYVQDLIISLKYHSIEDNECFLLIQTLNELNQSKIPLSNDLLKSLFKKKNPEKDLKFEANKPLGIVNNGLAGIGLNIIWRIGQ